MIGPGECNGPAIESGKSSLSPHRLHRVDGMLIGHAIHDEVGVDPVGGIEGDDLRRARWQGRNRFMS